MYKNPRYLPLIEEIFTRESDAARVSGNEVDTHLFFYRWILAVSNGEPIENYRLKEIIPIWKGFAERELPNLERFNEWAENLEKKYSLISTLRQSGGIITGTVPPHDKPTPPFSLEDEFNRALTLYGKPLEVEKEEAEIRQAREEMKKRRLNEPRPEPCKLKLVDIPIVEIDPPLPETLINNRTELSIFLRQLLVANGGKIEYKLLLQLLDKKRQHDWSIWKEFIRPDAEEFEEFYWILDPRAPEAVKDSFPKNLPKDMVGYYFLKLKRCTAEDREYHQQLLTTLKFVRQLIAYFLSRNKLDFEGRADICKNCDLDPDSSLRPLARLSNGFFTYHEESDSLTFHRDKYEQAVKKIKSGKENNLGCYHN